MERRGPAGQVRTGAEGAAMHEMSLAEGVLRIIEAQAREQDFTRVKTVRLELGQLSHAAPEALAFCYDAVVRGTVAEGSRLEIVRTPGQAQCLACDRTVALARRYDPCPHCGGHRLQVIAGEEMRVKELEVQ